MCVCVCASRRSQGAQDREKKRRKGRVQWGAAWREQRWKREGIGPTANRILYLCGKTLTHRGQKGRVKRQRCGAKGQKDPKGPLKQRGPHSYVLYPNPLFFIRTDTYRRALQDTLFLFFFFWAFLSPSPKPLLYRTKPPLTLYSLLALFSRTFYLKKNSFFFFSSSFRVPSMYTVSLWNNLPLIYRYLFKIYIYIYMYLFPLARSLSLSLWDDHFWSFKSLNYTTLLSKLFFLILLFYFLFFKIITWCFVGLSRDSLDIVWWLFSTLTYEFAGWQLFVWFISFSTSGFLLFYFFPSFFRFSGLTFLFYFFFGLERRLCGILMIHSY